LWRDGWCIDSGMAEHPASLGERERRARMTSKNAKDEKSAHSPKERLDVLVAARGLAESRAKAQALILAGRILVNGRAETKAGTRFPADAAIARAGDPIPVLSRGGLKLDAALREFGVDAAGKTALDVGSSTGGFTDCLLQRGAARVVAVDVGRGQLHERLRADPRVELHERTNARHLAPDFLKRPADLIVMDLSFISLGKVLGALRPLLAPEGCLIALIKPQFEAGPRDVPRGGVVRDPEVHRAVLEKVARDFEAAGFRLERTMESPIHGADGNREFLGLARLLARPAETSADAANAAPRVLE